MSVGRRLMVSLVTLVACTALLGGAAVAGLLALSHRYQAAEDQYRELRSVYEIGFRAASVRQLLQASNRDDVAIRQHLFLAATEAQELTKPDAPGGPETVSPQLDTLRRSIEDRLSSIDADLAGTDTRAGLQADVNAWLSDVASLAAAAQHRIVENRRQASAQFQTVLVIMVGVFAATVVIAIVVGVKQYRSVMRPVRALDRAVAHLADIRLGHQIEEHGDREFHRLMHHFNRMSRALEHLHASMHHQVEMKSRQLVRSEQLASVGTLAAGIAHEINNPLAIIAGYAQTSLRKLDRATDPAEREEAVERARRTLEVVCEEAFRCKEIALQLLRMAHPADGEPEEVELDPLVRQAIALVSRLPAARGRDIAYRCDGAPEELVCLGHPSQVLQVLINLVTNALEACPAEGGRVIISLELNLGTIQLTVADNGCGMTTEALIHAFDPFYTDKPRRGLEGSGLGLSITHAIIERHGGRVCAHSDGPGCGSVFTVELPVFTEEAARDRSHAEHTHA